MVVFGILNLYSMNMFCLFKAMIGKIHDSKISYCINGLFDCINGKYFFNNFRFDTGF